MNRLIKILGVVGVLVIALIVAGVAILKSMDFNEYRTLIAEKAKQATGRDLTINGDLELNISFSPSVSVDGVTFSNAPWGSGPEMLSLDTFAAEVALIPLLSGDVQIKRVVLKGLKVLLETNSDGTPNWQFDTAQSTGEAQQDTSSQGGSLPVVHTLQIRDVSLVYKDGVTGETQNLSLPVFDLSSTGASSPMNLIVEAVLNDETFKIKGDLGSVDVLSDNRMFPVKLAVEALGATIDLDGTISSPRDAKGLNMGFTIKADNIASVAARGMALAGVDGDAPLPDKAITVSGAFRDGEDVFSIDGLKLKIGSSDLAGNLSVNLSGSVPELSADLTSENFDLVDVSQQSDAQAVQTATSSGTSAQDDGRVFPNDPLPLDGLKAANVDIGFNAKSVMAQGLKLSDVTVQVVLNNGTLVVSPLGATFADGRIKGDVKLDGSSFKAKLALKVSASQIDYGKLYKENAGDEMIRGKLDLDINLNGTGSSVRSLMAGLNGKLRVTTENGYIDSAALGFITGPLTALFEGEDAKNLRCAVVDFDIVKGMANSKATVFETGGLSIVGAGKIDLRDEKLDLQFDPRAKNTSLASAAQIGIIVTGTLKEPSVGPDMGDVALGVASTAAGIATGGLSTVIGMVVDTASDGADNTDYCALALAGKPLKAEAQASPPESTSQQPKSQTQEDNSVGGVLKNLFGN